MNNKLTSGELIDLLKSGNVLYKKYYEDNTCIEYMFIECGKVCLRGWGSALGHSHERINEIIFYPENWNVVKNFNMSQEYPYPWSTTYNKPIE